MYAHLRSSNIYEKLIERAIEALLGAFENDLFADNVPFYHLNLGEHLLLYIGYAKRGTIKLSTLP